MEPQVASDIGWIVDDLPVAVCVVAVPHGHLTYANRAFRSLVGETGARFRVSTNIQAAFARVMETREAVTLERVPLGERELAHIEVRVSAQPMLDAARRMTHVRIALLGGPPPSKVETERAATQAELERRLQTLSIQNDRVMALGTLAASVAHEINNPLSYILVHAEQIGKALGKLDAIVTQLEGPPALELEVWLGKLRQHFGTMKSGTERIAAITRELRSFSRPDDDSLEAIDLSSVVRSVLHLIGKKLENVARLSLNLQEAPLVQGNRARLVQVVFNLVVNAMQALPRGVRRQHEIAIRCSIVHGRAILDVSDTGPGVPAADRERIFDPFVTTKGSGEGTGLGLFVCRNILRAYAGTLSVADREGGGALFRVSLPLAGGVLAKAPLAAPEAVSPPTPRIRQRVRHILVIDDEPLVARALCARLRRAGYRASRETDGRSGLRRLLGADDIDLAFCDLLMSDMNGMDLLAELKLRAPEKLSNIVFMTGSAFSDSARQVEVEAGGRVIEKPFDIVKEAQRRLRESR